MEVEAPAPAAVPAPAPVKKEERDFLEHLESYLSKRDGVDKLLKISRYASKLILASSLVPALHPRLSSFDSSVGLSRKAFRLGKFIQDLNSLRATSPHLQPPHRFLLSLISYGGEGLYYFVEQIVWLSKSGLIHPAHARNLQKLSAWAELIGYVGSLTLKLEDLIHFNHNLGCLDRGDDCEEEEMMQKQRALKHKIVMKKMSIIQDMADALMAIADIRDNAKGGILSSPFLLSSAGLLSALISTHKNWLSS